MKKKLTNLTIAITLIIIIIATIIINKNKIEAKHEEYKNITNYLIKKPDVKSEYIAVIQIPKLNFQKGIYSFAEEENNVDNNIMLIEESTFPDEKNSNIILAAHSGQSEVAYFNNLDKLEIDDDIIIYYNGMKYIYRLNKVYTITKNGKLAIPKRNSTATLTLVTCSKTNNIDQYVYIAYLNYKEMY